MGPRRVVNGARLGIVDLGADDVGRQHVGGELDREKRTRRALGEGFDRQGLGQAGHAFEQDMAVGEQPDDQPFDQVALADDDFTHFAHERADK